jgi:hypothetical protein
VPAENGFQSTFGECAPAAGRAAGDGNSLYPIARFVDYLKGLKSEDRLIVSAITGWARDEMAANETAYRIVNGEGGLGLQPMCSSEAGKADPPVRIASFVKSFQNNTIESICNNDFSPALTRIGELIGRQLDPGCIDQKLIDSDPATPGTQVDCIVSQKVDDNEEIIPACADNGNATPCWRMLAKGEGDNTNCTNWKLVVDRGGEAPPVDAQQAVKCAACTSDIHAGCKE